ncbi:MAG: chemotaxis protein, partial [Microcoleus sp. SIO2G3]|nr:chemotaxis protein [Microcoleus sp. SIO2G3]
MASGTDYAQEYGQAEKAYMQGKYPEAAAIVDRLAQDFPNDPSVLLLRGHIYCYGLQQYDVAREQYEQVLNLTSEPDFISYANNGLEYANQFNNGSGSGDFGFSTETEEFDGSYHELGETDDLDNNTPTFETWQEPDTEEDLPSDFDLKSLGFDEEDSDDFSPTSAASFSNPFGSSVDDYDGIDDVPETDSDAFGSIGADDPFDFTANLSGEEDFETFEIGTNDFDLDASAFGTSNLDDRDEYFSDTPQEDTGMTFVMPPPGDFEEPEGYETLS